MSDSFIIILTSVLGAFLTFEVSNNFKINKITTSALLSFTVAIFFRYCPKFFSPDVVHLIPVAFFGASLIGMSAEKVILKTEILFSGIIFGILFMFITSYFKGFGGGLGITACISVIITLGIKITYEKLTEIWIKNHSIITKNH